MSGPRVLIVEDDPRLGPIMRDVLAARWDVILTASAEEALERITTEHVAVLVVDRRLPGMSGTDLVTRLRRSRVDVPVILLTALGELADRVAGLDAGADDYLVKPFEFAELEARLRALTRERVDRGEDIAIGSWWFSAEQSCITSPYRGRVMLTRTETALLSLLAEHPERVFSREVILDAVFRRGEDPGTVDTYVSYLRRKTDRDLITTVRGSGYRVGTPD
ncbi:response regulator transcription factor [Microbacterium gorillae]|uniref:response regulator transcription factor n=1 Tax=Microbacterium gorillae TaxID=1231063 RepID=UPI000590C73A|nr:response regulator transcription factor [Microbacterium gorillae]